MMNCAFNALGAKSGDYYPEELRLEIEGVNTRVYDTLNNGVYKAGFATSQTAYEEAIAPLFETLDWLESRLESARYLVGNRLTEADIRLFTTLVRFDSIYYGHFKCNLRRVVDYPNLWAYTRDLFQTLGIGVTVNLDHAKRHYYESHRTINPTGIVPKGPILDFTVCRRRVHRREWRRRWRAAAEDQSASCAYSDAREGVRNSLSAPAGTVAVFYFSRLGSVVILCSSSPFTRAPVAPTIPAPLRHHREFKRRPLSIIIIIPSVPVMAVMPIMVAMPGMS
jgi:Glutathione S-transferase, C-terminal domain